MYDSVITLMGGVSISTKSSHGQSHTIIGPFDFFWEIVKEAVVDFEVMDTHLD